MFASPVPYQMMFGLDGATVDVAALRSDAACSKIGSKVTPSFSVFHSPPDARGHVDDARLALAVRDGHVDHAPADVRRAEELPLAGP